MKKIITSVFLLVLSVTMLSFKTSVKVDAQQKNSDGDIPMVEEITQDEVKFHFLDVNSLPLGSSVIGSADCIIIQDNGKTTVIDAGEVYDNSIAKICNYLDSLNVTKIDHLFLTHPHSDHGGGMPSLIAKYDVANVYLKGMDWSTMREVEFEWRTREIYDDVYLAAQRKLNSDNTTVNIVIPGEEGQKIVVNENSYFEIFNCTEVFELNAFEAEFNDYSMVVKYTHKDVSALLMGDINRSWEKMLLGKVGKCDILKVAHHGTPGSLPTKSLFTEVQSKYCVISGVNANTFIHPEWAPDWEENGEKMDNIHKICTFMKIEEAITEQGDIIISTDGTTCSLAQNKR